MASSPGRPLAFDPNAALEAAMQLFWSRGYEHVSLQDLLRSMGLSKSSLYQAFGSKRELFQRCVQRYRDRLVADLREDLAQAPRARDFLVRFVQSASRELADGRAPRGCLVMNTANEFGQSDQRIADDIVGCLDGLRRVLVEAIERAKAEGDIARARDTHTLANYLITSLSGLKNQAKAGVDAKTLNRIAAVVIDAL